MSKNETYTWILSLTSRKILSCSLKFKFSLSSAYALTTKATLQTQDLACLKVSVFLKAQAAMLVYPLTSPAMSLEILWFMWLCCWNLCMGNNL